MLEKKIAKYYDPMFVNKKNNKEMTSSHQVANYWSFSFNVSPSTPRTDLL